MKVLKTTSLPWVDGHCLVLPGHSQSARLDASLFFYGIFTSQGTPSLETPHSAEPPAWSPKFNHSPVHNSLSLERTVQLLQTLQDLGSHLCLNNNNNNNRKVIKNEIE